MCFRNKFNLLETKNNFLTIPIKKLQKKLVNNNAKIINIYKKIKQIII